MILEDVLCDLKTRVLESGLIKVFYEYCELVQRGEITQPEYYVSNGQYQPVYNFDVNGSGYVRKIGSVSVKADLDRMQLTGCAEDNLFQIMTYPLRAVFGVPKSKLGDNAYSDEVLYSEMVEIFGGSYSAQNVQSISTSIQSYDTDSLSIWSNEVRGKDHQMNFNLSYISIDFNLEFSVNKNCIKEVCGYGY